VRAASTNLGKVLTKAMRAVANANDELRGVFTVDWNQPAPDYVLRYLVTHEAVHLAAPDHSARFWLMVQSLCRETEKAKQWLCRHQVQRQVDLKDILKEAPENGRLTASS
jgi:hypothetical protein